MEIKEGLEIVIFKHYSHIELESDSIVALTLVQENSNAKLKYLLDECRSLIQRLKSLKLHHTFRQENKIEDHLASLWRLSLKQQLHAIMSRRAPSWKYSNLIMDWEQKLGLLRRVPFRGFFLSFVVLPILGRIVLFALYFILLPLFLSWSRIFYF